MNATTKARCEQMGLVIAFVAALVGGIWLVSLAIDKSTRIQADATVQSRHRFIEWKNMHAPYSTYTCFDRWPGMSCTLSGGLLSTPIQVMCGRDGCWLDTPG